MPGGDLRHGRDLLRKRFDDAAEEAGWRCVGKQVFNGRKTARGLSRLGRRGLASGRRGPHHTAADGLVLAAQLEPGPAVLLRIF
jgi:hypothetical protein